MRSLFTALVVGAASLAPLATAGVVFDYNGTAPGDAAALSAYMTGVYGSQVTMTGAYATDNTPPGIPPTLQWSGNASDYVRVGLGPPPQAGPNDKDFEITFDQIPIIGVQLLGYIFDEQRGPTDFQIFAYDSTYGNRENPSASALVFQQAFDVTMNGVQVFVGTPQFSRPVSLLVFSNHGRFDVGIDDMTVTIPEPASTITALAAAPLLFVRRRRVR